MARDPEIVAHQEWLGYVQPVGLVVSIPALVNAGAYINRNFAPDHRRFLEALPTDKDGQPVPEIRDLPSFAASFFGWTASDLYGVPGAPGVPPSLEVALPEYNETLRPNYALRDFEPADGAREFLMLIQEFTPEIDFDTVAASDVRHWQASPQAKFERLLRQAGIPIGLLVNRRQIRLVYAPEKELSGHITFNIGDMISVVGRPICAAMQMLLCSERLYTGSPEQRLPAILANSRKYQNVVSTQLAEQVLEALYEMLRGFQAANDQTRGDLLHTVLSRDPDHVYHGLLTVLLRLVFLLFAEDRGLLSTDPIYANNYSVTGLYERLREDNGRYADLMDQRFGAWAQLLALFRLIYSGGSHGTMRIPAREGYLFDPDRYLFLEGRKERNDRPVIPRVSDGVVFRVLSKLFLLDGERLSYRTLAVEQIGSVYQAIMGFSLQLASGRSIAIRPAKKHGAPATIDLEKLLATPPDKRLKQFTDDTDQKLTGQAAEALKLAQTVDELLAGLERKIATAVTPMPVPKGAMVFQPSDERRKSGSHYTPSSLTGPIVETALQPVLRQLGPSPTPAQILNVKVCDLAMGSAAFLVEACRQLGDVLAKAWHAHNELPDIPPDEDEALYAQRQIAQRGLYGLDRNPMAADLAKLSLWLATLAKDHPFTFLDHSLRHGDALVGLTRKQIASFNWAPAAQQSFLEQEIRGRIVRATEYRQRILDARDSVSYARLEQELGNADDALNLPRMVGDAAISAFFAAGKAKQREERRRALQKLVEDDLKRQRFLSVDGEVDQAIQTLRKGAKGIAPFHWEMEFPEVFTTDTEGTMTGGFDVIVGNPPFMGGARIWPALGGGYADWIRHLHTNSEGKAVDLVAHFFRRAFNLLRSGGCLGLISTNSIAQGDTREAGLKQIRKAGGEIYRAIRRLRWPGEAAVVVSVVSITKGQRVDKVTLDGRQVSGLNSFLFPNQTEFDPVPLAANANGCFQGACILGMGFTFDDTDTTGVASPISVMRDLIQNDRKNQQRIFPYIGGKEINSDPLHLHHRYVIDFEDMSLEESSRWPSLVEVVRKRVKPERDRIGGYSVAERRKEFWWQFGTATPALNRAKAGLKRVLAMARHGNAFALTFVPGDVVCSEGTIVFPFETDSAFAVLQSRVHETWARFFGSSIKDDLRYTPLDCFETLPFPENWLVHSFLVTAGQSYYELRARIMANKNEGLTATYNHFHDPDERDPEILKLRDLHDAMDRATLEAYGWSDIVPRCKFIREFDEEDDQAENDNQERIRYRYRWPDEIRDEVLARLLELNRQRALEEGQLQSNAPKRATPPGKNGKTRKGRTSPVAEPVASLFAADKGDD